MDKKAIQICDILQKNGHQAVLAGGAVRDMIMGIEPHDFDIATSASPDIVATLLEENQFKIKEVGKSFGVVLAKIEESEYEIATFRTESDYLDGRRPSKVVFSTIEEDAWRRDLTINALFFDPIAGRYIDYVGGREDIQKKIIQFVGNADERINEDKLRMLRAIRFAVKFDWSIEPETFIAIAAHASEISMISPERIRQEFEKMFMCKRPSRMIDLLISTGLMEIILPEVAKLRGLRQDPRWHPEGDVLTHTKLVLEMLKDESFELQCAALFHDIGKADTFREENGIISAHGHAELGAEQAEGILKRLKFSNDQITHITALVRDHMKVHSCMDMKTSTIRRLIAELHFPDLIRLAEADDAASRKDFKAITFLKGKQIEFASEVRLPTPIVKGADLIAMGLKPGPMFRDILGSVMNAQLEGRFITKEEGISLVKEMLE